MHHIDQAAQLEAFEARRLEDRLQAFRAAFTSRKWSEAPSVDPGASVSVLEAPSGATGEGPRYSGEGAPGGPERGLPLSIQEPKSLQTGNKGLTGVLGGPGVEGLVRRLGRYGRAVEGVGELVEFLRSEAVGQVGKVLTADRAERLSSCGSWLEFRHFFTRPDLPVKLHSGQFCGQPLMCGLCAIKRAAKMLRAYLPKILTAVNPGVRAYLVTFTQPSGPDLREQWRKLDGYLRKFWKGRNNSRNGRGRFRASSLINGAVFSVEVKRGEGSRGGGWHVHAHGLVLADGELDGAAIAAEWVEVTGGLADARAQDVRELRSMVLFDSEEATESQLANSAAGDLVEVFKYPMKFASLAPADRWEAFRVLLGRRLIRPLGALYHLQADERFLEEPLQVEDLPYVRLLFRFSGGQYSLEDRIFIDRPNRL